MNHVGSVGLIASLAFAVFALVSWSWWAVFSAALASPTQRGARATLRFFFLMITLAVVSLSST